MRARSICGRWSAAPSRRVTAEAAERAVTLVPELPEAVLTCCDVQQMQRVVITLLDNAIRFSPPGRAVHVHVTREDACCIVRVTDTGAGIDPAYLPRVFEAFASADIAHHTAGHGVSLAIAQQITQAHQGTIHVESTRGGDHLYGPLAAGARVGPRDRAARGRGGKA